MRLPGLTIFGCSAAIVARVYACAPILYADHTRLVPPPRQTKKFPQVNFSKRDTGLHRRMGGLHVSRMVNQDP